MRRPSGLLAAGPVALAAGVLAASLAGAPIYVSSAGSAAYEEQLAEQCSSQTALALPIPSSRSGVRDADARTIESIASQLVHVDPPIRTHVAGPRVQLLSSLGRVVTVFHVEGVEEQLGLRPLAFGEIAVSDTNMTQLLATLGDRLPVEGGMELTVAQRFDDVPPLALIGCLDRPDRGTVELLGVDVGGLSRRDRRRLRRTTAATVLAEPADNLLLPRTGIANITMAAQLRGADRSAVDTIIERLAIASFVDRTCQVMSGGEQQRVALACALVGATPLVIADEPTAALDAVSATEVIAALRTAADGGSAVVVATHDPNVIGAADAIVGLEHGKTVGYRRAAL